MRKRFDDDGFIIHCVDEGFEGFFLLFCVFDWGVFLLLFLLLSLLGYNLCVSQLTRFSDFIQEGCGAAGKGGGVHKRRDFYQESFLHVVYV